MSPSSDRQPWRPPTNGCLHWPTGPSSAVTPSASLMGTLAIQWDHLGPPRSIEELATRLVYGHVADVVMRAAHQCQDLSQVRSQARKLAKEARLWVTPALAVLGLRLDGLTIDRLEDDSRWEHEA